MMSKPILLLVVLLFACVAFAALVHPARRVPILAATAPSASMSSWERSAAAATTSTRTAASVTREAARDPLEAVPVILDNALACAKLSAAKYEIIRLVGADTFINADFQHSNAAVQRSLELQQRLLDEARHGGGKPSASLVKLFSAESALCELAAHPRGTLITFGLESVRLQTS